MAYSFRNGLTYYKSDTLIVLCAEIRQYWPCTSKAKAIATYDPITCGTMWDVILFSPHIIGPTYIGRIHQGE
jgi:hypothetical protein